MFDGHRSPNGSADEIVAILLRGWDEDSSGGMANATVTVNLSLGRERLFGPHVLIQSTVRPRNAERPQALRSVCADAAF